MRPAEGRDGELYFSKCLLSSTRQWPLRGGIAEQWLIATVVSGTGLLGFEVLLCHLLCDMQLVSQPFVPQFPYLLMQNKEGCYEAYIGSELMHCFWQVMPKCYHHLYL